MSLNTDFNNCGECFKVCPAGSPGCVAGQCQAAPAPTCSGGQTDCGTNGNLVCVSLDSNREHCGACSKACDGSSTGCLGGVCQFPVVVPTTSDMIATSAAPSLQPFSSAQAQTQTTAIQSSTSLASSAAPIAPIPTSLSNLPSGMSAIPIPANSVAVPGLICTNETCTASTSSADSGFKLLCAASVQPCLVGILQSLNDSKICLVAESTEANTVHASTCPRTQTRRSLDSMLISRDGTMFPYWTLLSGSNGSRFLNSNMNYSTGCLVLQDSLALGPCDISESQLLTVPVPPNSDSSSSQSTGVPIGAIVGAVVGAIFVFAVGGFLVYWRRRRREAGKEAELPPYPGRGRGDFASENAKSPGKNRSGAEQTVKLEKLSGKSAAEQETGKEKGGSSDADYSETVGGSMPSAGRSEAYLFDSDRNSSPLPSESSVGHVAEAMGVTLPAPSVEYNPTLSPAEIDTSPPQQKLPLKVTEGSSSDKGPAISPKLLITAGQVQIDHSRKLGEGGFGVVYAGMLRGLPVAVKTIRGEVDAKTMALFRKEVKVWEGLVQRNILPLLAICEVPPLMVTDLIEDGNLRRYLNARNWDQILGKRLLLDVTAGMIYLHSLNVFHGDLKSLNILVDGNRAVITDFGLSKIARELSKTSGRGMSFSAAGTAGFSAPEIMEGNEITKAADVYSFAMVCYEVVSRGMFPFEEVRRVAAVGKCADEQFLPRSLTSSDNTYTLPCR